MRARCLNPNHHKYKTYGGAGITVYQGWLGPGGFEAFLAYLGPKPTPKHTLDRHPDPNGNYEPGNVRWADVREQNHNRRSYVRWYTIDGVRRCVKEWAEMNNISMHTVYARLARGWDPKRAFTERPGPSVR